MILNAARLHIWPVCVNEKQNLKLILSEHSLSQYKVMEGVPNGGGGGGGGVPDMPPTFCFSAKERQLVQVVVSPYTYPTFMLSVAIVLLVVSC